MIDFETLYPGVYIGKEKEALDKHMAENKALNERGDIDIQALINGTLPKDTPGVGPSFVATEAMIRYNNAKYDPENPILNDAEYARKVGYKDILAMPCFGAWDDFLKVPYPAAARDTTFPSHLNHSVTTYKPIYPGDTLYLVVNSNELNDLTPVKGSTERLIARESTGSVYNQRGEKVNDTIFRVTVNMRIYKEGKKPATQDFASVWGAPDWTIRPQHYYTDDDWDTIRGIWSKEKQQGAEPLYWEDVNIGDEPAWTADGPIDVSVRPTGPYGMGTQGSRTLKKEIMDPEIFKTMIRSEKDGIYRLPNREDYIAAVPDIESEPEAAKKEAGAIDVADIHKQTEFKRAVLINFLARDIAIRHINNWMGDHGWLYNIRWAIMPPECHAAFGRIVPTNPKAERFLDKVPTMKGRFVLVHGLTGDMAIIKSYVNDKYVRNGQFFVELMWWAETIDGYIWEDGAAIVELPSRRAK